MRLMKIVVIVMAVFTFYFTLDTIVGVCREFEEDISDFSKVEIDALEYHSMIATAYCIDGTTATGTHTRPGVCASKREWFGKTAKVYKNDHGKVGELIGTYTVEDTGGRPIRNGSVIDIWLPTEDECDQFGRKTVYVVIE